MIRTLIALILLMHGVGHLLFLGNAWGYWTTGSGRSWLFDNTLGLQHTVEGIVGLLWMVPLVAFVAVAGGYFANQGWWPRWAVVAAVISLGLVVVWWGGINSSSAFFALVVNAAVIGLALWQPDAAPLVEP